MAEDELREIRRIRHEISERYGHDTDRYVDHLQQVQKELRETGGYGSGGIPLPEKSPPSARSTEAAA
jgi:hypothetical protein